MPRADVLIHRREVEEAGPGLYVAREETGAFFPLLAMVSAGDAKLVGEKYDGGGRIIVVQVETPPPPVGGFGEVEEPQRRSITIGREFFVSAISDYGDGWPEYWWREAIQNSVDAGAQNIALSVTQNPDNTRTVVCDDDGRGMDEGTLISKFLVLGATTKIVSSGSAGGFGKAKELLLLPWLAWRIHSRDVLVEGAGIDYTVQQVAPRVGTRLEVIMPEEKYTRESAAIAFIEKCYLPHVRFTVNGKHYRAALEATKFVQSIEGKVDVYHIPGKDKQPYMYVRTHGLFMFAQYASSVEGYLIVELTVPSVQVLTANRLSFSDHDLRWGLGKLAEKIAKDNLSALAASKGLIRRKFLGTGKFRAGKLAAGLLEQIGPTVTLSTQDQARVIDMVVNYRQYDEQAQRTLPSPETATVLLDQKFSGTVHLEAALKQLVWEPDFFLINEIEGFKIPKKFFPETMSPTVAKLAKTWVELIRYVMMQLGSEVRFGVGFIFSERKAAAAVKDVDEDGEAEHWLVLNPYHDMRPPSEIWHPTVDANLKWLYAAAIHECTHIADGELDHDESFASALTRNMAKCAAGYRRIRSIVAGIRMHGGIEAD